MNPLVLTTHVPNSLRRLDLDASTGATAREMFAGAAERFRGGIENWVEYDSNDHAEEGEGLCISNYELDAAFLLALKQPVSVNRIEAKQLGELPIKSIIGHNENAEAPEFYFQNFDISRIMAPKTGLRLVRSISDSSTFEELERPVISLRSDIAVIWKDETLYFKDFYAASRIFDLKAYYRSATDGQVEEFCQCAHFSSGSYDILKDCAPWYRKRIAFLLESGVLDEISVAEFQSVATAHDYPLSVKDGKIQVPTDKAELKELLDFLCENFSIGPFSKKHWKLTGKRPRPTK